MGHMTNITHHNYRAHKRGCCESLIKYANVNSEDYHDAKMRNISASGIYFESESKIFRQGAEICVKVPHIPSDADPDTCNDYRAEVMWCREIANEGGVSYGIGARFMISRCDHCGEKFPHRKIHRTDDFLFLCSDCLEQLKTLPDGELRESVENYLLGNVL